MANEKFIQSARQAGYTDDQINKYIGKRSGVGGWLTEGKGGLSGVVNSIANVLNIPSYVVGSALNQGQRAFGSQYGQDSGFFQGIKDKRAVFSELPETLGVDPNSKLGMGIGFAGELLTPELPMMKLGKLGKLGIQIISHNAKLRILTHCSLEALFGVFY